MMYILLLTYIFSFCLATKRPHILFIVADDYGWNDVGYHQNKPSSANPKGGQTTNHVIATPTLDSLSADGIRLENYYVQPLCSPTRSTIMTGRYPFHSGMGPDVLEAHEPFGLPAREQLLPEFLTKGGYWTSAIGKWHLGMCDERYTPTFRGFREWIGYLSGAEGYFDHVNGYYDFRNGSEYEKLAEACPTARGVYSSELFSAEADRMISNYKHRNESRPLFMYVAMQATHNPYQAPDSYSDGYLPINQSCTEKTAQHCMNRYKFAGMVTGLDRAVKNITDSFRKYGLWEDTVLIFTTDNGAEMGIGSGNNFPLRGGKVSNWEGGLRGVAFVRGTESNLAPLSKGKTTLELMHSTDWLLTVCSIAQIECKTRLPLDGHDQWPVLMGTGENQRKFIWHNVPNPKNDTPVARLSLSGGALRVGDWKFLYIGRESETTRQFPPPGFEPDTKLVVPEIYNDSYWLFNISADPTESVNLASKHPFILQRMIDQYNSILSSSAYVNDLAMMYGYKDPNAAPVDRPDKTWGPWVNRSSCVYGREFPKR